MKVNLYLDVEVLRSGYIYLNGMLDELNVIASHDNYVSNCKKWGVDQWECLDGFKKRYVYIEVEYDGRKGIHNKDAMNSLCSKGYALDTGIASIYGNFYLPTDDLKNLLEKQLGERKSLATEQISAI